MAGCLARGATTHCEHWWDAAAPCCHCGTACETADTTGNVEDFRRAVGATPGCADCAVADMACLRHALTAALTRLASGSQSAEVRHG